MPTTTSGLINVVLATECEINAEWDNCVPIAVTLFCAAMNPCPCGYYGDPVRECTCSMQSISRYQKRISGPLLDRIDIHVEVPRVDVDKLTADRLGERSEAIRARVEAAREVQREPFAETTLSCNADMGPTEVRRICQLDEEGRGLVKAAMQQLGMGTRLSSHLEITPQWPVCILHTGHHPNPR